MAQQKCFQAVLFFLQEATHHAEGSSRAGGWGSVEEVVLRLLPTRPAVLCRPQKSGPSSSFALPG